MRRGEPPESVSHTGITFPPFPLLSRLPKRAPLQREACNRFSEQGCNKRGLASPRATETRHAASERQRGRCASGQSTRTPSKRVWDRKALMTHPLWQMLPHRPGKRLAQQSSGDSTFLRSFIAQRALFARAFTGEQFGREVERFIVR